MNLNTSRHNLSTRRFDARRAGFALALGAALIAPGGAYAQAIGVQLNGRAVNFAEAAPVNAGGSVLVPMRGVFEAMQAQVRFVAATNTIIASRGQRQIQISLGAATAFVDGAPVALSQPARSINGRTFVPLRFVADALGARVAWNAGSNTVQIEDPTLAGAGAGGAPSIPQAPANAAPAVILERVDLNEPPRLIVREGGVLRSYEMAANAEAFRQVGNGPTFGPLAPIELSELRAGEDVKISQQNGLVSQIVARRSVRGARVQSVNGSQIVLDDGTALTISSRVRFFEADGREAGIPANLQPGTPIALYVRPGTEVVYAVSASPGDVAAAGNSTLSNNGNGNGGNGGTTGVGTGTGTVGGTGARITLVQHNAKKPLGLGASIRVEVRGTPGARATYDLSPRLKNLPMREDTPGAYSGTYVVKADDDVLDAPVTARLATAAGVAAGANANQEDVAQSRVAVTIDTLAPRVVDMLPRAGAIVTDARPTIIVNVDDVGGSGLASARMVVTQANGQSFEVPMTVVPPARVQGIIDRALSGRVSLRIRIVDAAGNAREVGSSLNVQPRAGAIASVVHNATRPLRDGSSITVDMQAQQGGRATFDLVDERDQVVAQRVPMTEVNPGRYRGTQTLQQIPEGASLRVRARFDDGGGAIDTLEAATEVPLAREAGTVGAGTFSITSPTANEAPGATIAVRGRGVPGALIEVSVTAKGTRTLFGIIGYQPYEQVLDTKQVRVDAVGNWTAPAIALAVPRNVKQPSYEVSAQQTDLGNIKSQPETVTLTAPAQ